MSNLMIKKRTITPEYKKAKKLIKEGKIEEAGEILWKLIGILASMTLNGIHGSEIIEGIKLDLWKDRVWLTLENNDLM